jgi:hypothetical protein
MKRLLFILTFTLIVNFCYSQTDIFGYYEQISIEVGTLDLLPNYTYSYCFYGSCGQTPAYKDSGIFKLVADTIVLQSKDTTRKDKKFLIARRNFNELFCVWDIEKLVQLFKSDFYVSHGNSKLLLDDRIMFRGRYFKRKGYYSDNTIMFKIERITDTKIITNYYPSGKLKSIEQFQINKKLEDKKTGDWLYYDENGTIFVTNQL